MACAKRVVNVRWAKAVKEGAVACEGVEEEGDEKPPLAPPKEGNLDEGLRMRVEGDERLKKLKKLEGVRRS